LFFYCFPELCSLRQAIILDYSCFFIASWSTIPCGWQLFLIILAFLLLPGALLAAAGNYS